MRPWQLVGFSLPFFAFLLVVLVVLPDSAVAYCGIYSAGTPKTSSGIPYCPCGQAYILVGCSPPTCSSTCDSTWTKTGCYTIGSGPSQPPYLSASYNIRCQCPNGGACCQTGSSSGIYQPSSYVCHASTVCSNAVHCSGSSASCPAVSYKSSSTLCGSSSGPCQNNAYCTGSSTSCPASTYKSSSTLCASAPGVCANNAYCTGSTAACPANTYKASSTVCSSATGPCQNNAYCTGSTPTCPAQTYKSSSTICSGKSGICQNDAYCTGSSVSCPSNTFVASGTLCSAKTGPCQNDATCTGSSSLCPANTYAPTSTMCKSGSGPCENAAYCDGTTAPCPATTYKNNSTVCYNSRGPCDTTMFCNGTSSSCPPTQYLPSDVTCASTTFSCFNAANCTGSSPYCGVISAKPEGTVCGNNTLCSQPHENTCDSLGDCQVYQCPACPNGQYGGDCSCTGGPPTDSDVTLNATCVDGTWYVPGDITHGNITIQPGTHVVFEGNVTLPDGSTIVIGSGSLLNVTGCTTFNGTLIGLFDAQFSNASRLSFDPNCSFVSPIISETVQEANGPRACKSSQVSSSAMSGGLLNILFAQTSTCSFNYILYVIVPVCSVIGALIIIVPTIIIVRQTYFRKKAKQMLGGEAR